MPVRPAEPRDCIRVSAAFEGGLPPLRAPAGGGRLHLGNLTPTLGPDGIPATLRRMDHTFDNLIRRKGYDEVLGVACLIPLDAAGLGATSLTAGGRTCPPSCRRAYPISADTAQASAINASLLGLSVTLGFRHPLCSRSTPIVSCQQECDKSVYGFRTYETASKVRETTSCPSPALLPEAPIRPVARADLFCERRIQLGS